MINNCDKADAENIPIIKNWLDTDGLHFTETLTTEEQEI